MSTRNLIIGGVSKSGTTSVFRYLCAHPDIRPSMRKELSFFFVHRAADGDELNANYAQYFEPAEDGVFLEASPRYLQDGTDVALAIERALPDVRMLFLLRDPADRLGSYYRSKFRSGQRVGTDMEFAQFVDLALNAAKTPVADLDPELVPIRNEVERGLYGEQLGQYLAVFSAEQIMVGFFEMLQDDPLSLMQSVCRFVGLDESFYDDFGFTVENRSRLHRWNWLRRIAAGVNQKLEPWLNESPRAKSSVRRVYDFINVEKKRIPVSDSEKEPLRQYFRSSNSKLRQTLLDTYPDIALPDWLKDENA